METEQDNTSKKESNFSLILTMTLLVGMFTGWFLCLYFNDPVHGSQYEPGSFEDRMDKDMDQMRIQQGIIQGNQWDKSSRDDYSYGRGKNPC